VSLLPCRLCRIVARQSLATSSHKVTARRYFTSQVTDQTQVESSTKELKGKGKADSQNNSYSATLHLPKTNFPIKADAAKRELLYRARTTTDLYRWQWNRNRKKSQEVGQGVEERPFVLHDGPPYANGNLHMGHAMNKILKDIINRYQVFCGRRVHYAPGWDCHGLPIELKALIELEDGEGKKAPGKAGKKALTESNAGALANAASKKLEPLQVRQIAKKKALEAIVTQKEEFRRFGIMANWDNPTTTYRTLDLEYEVRQMRLLGQMVAKGELQN
jgi:isoleucyl-tRNA synthetase